MPDRRRLLVVGLPVLRGAVRRPPGAARLAGPHGRLAVAVHELRDGWHIDELQRPDHLDCPGRGARAAHAGAARRHGPGPNAAGDRPRSTPPPRARSRRTSELRTGSGSLRPSGRTLVQVGHRWSDDGDRHGRPVAGRLEPRSSRRSPATAPASHGGGHDGRRDHDVRLHLRGSLRQASRTGASRSARPSATRSRGPAREHAPRPAVTSAWSTRPPAPARCASSSGRRWWSDDDADTGAAARRPTASRASHANRVQVPRTRPATRAPALRAVGRGRAVRRHGGAARRLVLAAEERPRGGRSRSRTRLPAGAVITADDLAGRRGRRSPARAIGSDDAPASSGSTAAVGLVDGQILTLDMVTTDPLPGPGERVVGLAAGRHACADAACCPGDVGRRRSPSRRPATRARPASWTTRRSWRRRPRSPAAELVEGAGTRLALVVPERSPSGSRRTSRRDASPWSRRRSAVTADADRAVRRQGLPGRRPPRRWRSPRRGPSPRSSSRRARPGAISRSGSGRRGRCLPETPTVLSVVTASRARRTEDLRRPITATCSTRPITVVPGPALAEQMANVGDWAPLADAPRPQPSAGVRRPRPPACRVATVAVVRPAPTWSSSCHDPTCRRWSGCGSG